MTYTTLPSGMYTFRVQGATSRGLLERARRGVAVEILPPWWSTWWFRALCAAAFLGLLWVLYQFRIQQLRRQEKMLRDVIETIPTFAWTALPDGSTGLRKSTTGRNTRVCLTERTVWLRLEAAVHPADLKRHAGEVARVSGEPASLSRMRCAIARAADGQYRWFLARAVPLRDQRGKIVKWYGISTDIEDRKRAEEEREKLRADLAHVNRVSMLGELAASLSHELKQPIAAAITRRQHLLAAGLHANRPMWIGPMRAQAESMNDGNRAAEIIERYAVAV